MYQAWKNFSRLLASLAIVYLYALCTIKNVHADLEARLDGKAIYDTDQGLTWIADANLAQTNSFGVPRNVSLGAHPADSSGNTISSGITDNGTMSWAGAFFWIDAMNEANYLGFSDWRLPRTLKEDTTCSSWFTGTPAGQNCTGSEMGYLFYVELGGKDFHSAGGIKLLDYQLFINVKNGFYLSETETENNVSHAWNFQLVTGLQTFIDKSKGAFALVVRDGDVGVSTALPDACIASYVDDGSLIIPCAIVSDEFNGKVLYQANMQIVPSSNPIEFELTQANQTEKALIDNKCAAIFQANGLLKIPCVTVPDISGNTNLYQAEMKFIPKSNPFAFKLIQASQIQ